MCVDDFEAAIKYIRSREKPLAIYLFTNDKQHVDAIVQRTSSGAVTVNDTMMHAGC
jgi:acyl-CoA reductase-like NAD-dependent aldehyde dehydrogenase